MLRGRALGRAFIMLSVCAVAIGASAALSQVQAPRLAALAMLQPGLWQVRAEGEPQRNVCVGDANALIQLRHKANACTRLVIANEKSSATIHYSCPGAGWGRTTLRVETPRLARIDTQGIVDNAPFAFIAEARRIGSCGERPGADH